MSYALAIYGALVAGTVFGYALALAIQRFNHWRKFRAVVRLTERKG